MLDRHLLLRHPKRAHFHPKINSKMPGIVSIHFNVPSIYFIQSIRMAHDLLDTAPEGLAQEKFGDEFGVCHPRRLALYFRIKAFADACVCDAWHALVPCRKASISLILFLERRGLSGVQGEVQARANMLYLQATRVSHVRPLVQGDVFVRIPIVFALTGFSISQQRPLPARP